MTEDQTPDIHVPIVADALDAVPPWFHCAAIVFDSTESAFRADLYSDAAASDLLPVLRAMVVRLETGTLRMPVDGTLRWVDLTAPD